MKRVILLGFLFWLSASGAIAQYKLYKSGTENFNAGKYETAIAQLEEFLSKWQHDKAHDDEIYYMLGVSYFKKSDYLNAMKQLDAAVRNKKDPSRDGSISWHLAICCDKLDRLNEALSEYGNAINLYRQDPGNCSKLLTERAKVGIKLQLQVAAKDDLTQALVMDPGNQEAKSTLENLGALMLASNRDLAGGETNTTETTKQKSGNETTSDTKLPPGNTKTTPGKEKEKEKEITPPKIIVEETPKKQTPTLEDVYGGEKRYALVIGNSNYPPTIGKLPNPRNDASDMADMLEKLGFTKVILILDGTREEMKNGILDLKKILDQSEREKTVALFYYAGHGVQAMDDNWLIPVDRIPIKDQDDISRLCLPVQKMVLDNLVYTNTRMNIVILDACRNNPFPSVHRSAGGNSGLQEIKRARGSFIAFATAPGSVASDGTGRNGLYTQELLKALDQPGLTIEQVFKEVRSNVGRLSNETQETWDNSNIRGEFFFNLKTKN